MIITEELKDPRFETLVEKIRIGARVDAVVLTRDWFGEDRARQIAVYCEAEEEANIQRMTGDHLILTESGAERLAEVRAFLDSLADTPEDRRTKRSFARMYAYLNEYGGLTEDGKHRRMRVTLGRDFAPYSFSVWFQIRRASGEYEHYMTGGLIYFDSDGTWGVHT